MIIVLYHSHSASVPELDAVNFYDHVILAFADSHVYLVVKITSNLPLTMIPMWSRQHNKTLPDDHHVMNYIKDGKILTSLIIEKVSYYDDGKYYVMASNYCGSSSYPCYVMILRKGKDIAVI